MLDYKNKSNIELCFYHNSQILSCVISNTATFVRRYELRIPEILGSSDGGMVDTVVNSVVVSGVVAIS